MDQTALLSSATLKALQLHQQPFRSTGANAADHANESAEQNAGSRLFSDETTVEQLADIKHALITGDDLLLVLGNEGSGKSTLLAQLDINSGLRIQCFPVQGSERFSTLNLFAGMLEAFKINPPDKLKEILDELIPCLQQMVSKNTLSTIVLDDAQLVNQAELTQLLSGMLYVNSQDETLMRVVLTATPEFEEKIPDLLPEGADMPYSSLTIDGFNSERASAYLGHRLQNAGFDGEFPFTERDMSSLVEHSYGLPGALHALTADVLNEKHGRIEDSLPPELMADNRDGFLQSRIGKLVVGGLATLLILLGLLMFLPGSEPGDTDQNNTVAGSTNNALQAQELKLIEAEPQQEQQREQEASTGQSVQPGTTNAGASEPVLTNNSTDGNTQQNLSSAANSESQNASVAQTTDVDTDVRASTNGSTSALGTARNENSAATDSSETGTSTLPSDSIESSNESVVEFTAGSSLNDNDNTGDRTSDPINNIGNANMQSEATQGSSEDSIALVEPEPVDALLENPPISEEDAELAERLESPNWILLQDPAQYTIQMSASRERASVENFLRQNPLPAPNSIFSFERDGVVWHALAHGIFDSIEDARITVERMPEAALRDQPWIRSIRRVQSILKTP